MRRLVAAGFSTSTIYKVLRQWNVPDEFLTALDNLPDEQANSSHRLNQFTRANVLPA